MEREVGEAHAAGGEAGEQFGREMQAGGGRGHRDLVRAIGIDRLIALEVEAALVRGVAAVDVGGQRHLAEAVGRRHDGFAAGRGEGDAGGAVAFLGEHGGRERAFPDEGGAGGKLPARTEQAPPLVDGARRAQQEALDLSARRPLRKQARRQHRGVVAEEDVAGAEEIGQVGENMMRHRAGARGRRRAGATGRGARRGFAQ